MGRSFSHHCSLGMRCLRRQDRERLGTSLGRDPELCPTFLGWGREGHALEIRLLAQLSDGLEHQAALAHPQQARRVGRVGKDPAWEGHGNVWEPPGGELGIFGIHQGCAREGWECLGIFRKGRTPGK